jgi:hypothetical protein
VPFPPFVVDHDIVRDRFGGHVCEVDPPGIVYSDELRAHLTQLVCDALNRDAEYARRERAEASYLRACVPPVHPADYGHEVWSATLRAEVAAERAAVVAWLREQREYGTDALLGQGFANVCHILSNEIERGEHRSEEEK